MSFAGRKPQNHVFQIRTRKSALDAVDDRRTPRSLFDPLHRRHRFTLDAAASASNAMLPRFWTIEEDALSRSWAVEMCWVNPPFSNLPGWVAKASHEVAHGCLGVVMLLPADRTEQPFWHEFIEPYRDRGLGVSTTFIRKRVKFALPVGHPAGDKGLAQGKSGGKYRYPPFGCVIVHFDAVRA